MAAPTFRSLATADRRRGILAAALECFATGGYEATTMAEIRRRAGASTGSVYHHFHSKEQLAAALYLEGIRQIQETLLAVLTRHSDGERGIPALVRAYLRWVEQNRDFGRYLLANRRAEFMGAAEADLERTNLAFYGTLQAWIAPHVEAGRLPRLPPELYISIVIGPSDHFARRWLRGKARTGLRAASNHLGRAALAALKDLARPS